MLSDHTPKTCSKCGKTKKPSDFHKSKEKKDGLSSQCKECRAAYFHDKHIPRRIPFPDCFWNKVNKNGPVPVHCPELGPCWIWTAWKSPKGYGGLRLNAHEYRAHRLSYEMAYGPFPSELQVLHYCDNPACVNPNHLWLGTNQDNIEDMKQKGRDRKAAGETHCCAKLTTEQVAEVRQKGNAGVSRKQLATEYGVTEGYVGELIRWKSRKNG